MDLFEPFFDLSQEWPLPSPGVNLIVGFHSKHFSMKSRKSGDNALSTCDKGSPPGLIILPFINLHVLTDSPSKNKDLRADTAKTSAGGLPIVPII